MEAARTGWGVRCAAVALGWLLLAGTALAQRAGEVEFVRGAGLARQPGEAPRVLGRGLLLQEGDRITTAEGAVAIIRLDDGTRITLRPNSELELAQWQPLPDASSDPSLVLRLLRGGLRALTGAIARLGPDAMRVETPVATLGIRGTDFDARLCGADCAAEDLRLAGAGRPNPPQASARLVSARGAVQALGADGRRRRLVEGGSVYPGDTVEAGEGGHAVLAFRDDSRMTLGPGARLRLDDFVFDPAAPAEGRFAATLLRGVVRTLTGLVARASPSRVGVSTAVATVGVRGTGFDLACTGACAQEPAGGAVGEPAGDGLSACAWKDAIVLRPHGAPAGGELAEGLCARVAGGALTSIPPLALPLLPRPDQVPVPPGLFAAEPVPAGRPGLYVQVRDGHVALSAEAGRIDLGRGETGFADAARVVRPLTTGGFLLADPVPLPTAPAPGATLLFDELGLPRTGAMCR